MLELLNALTIKEIVIYLIMFLFAAKGAIDLVDYFRGIYYKKFSKDYDKIRKEEELEDRYEQYNLQYKESIKYYQTLENKLDNAIERIANRFNGIELQLGQLTKSDMHSIKGWIVEKHHLLTAKGWVDDFTMDTLEYRYSDYKAENGNSYVDSLMEDLRELPHFPPEKSKENAEDQS